MKQEQALKVTVCMSILLGSTARTGITSSSSRVGGLLLHHVLTVLLDVTAGSACPTGVTTAAVGSTSIADCNSKCMQTRCIQHMICLSR